MIVTCPSCETHFNLAPAALGPEGRVMRCARCGHKWHARPSAAAAVPAVTPAAAPAARAAAPAAAPPPPKAAAAAAP
ncbi:MAG TPA: thioredoxin, partial [Rhodospirillaceae bacterium]|nr:thioredoxin [Rhodospirillaceae bacterium]